MLNERDFDAIEDTDPQINEMVLMILQLWRGMQLQAGRQINDTTGKKRFQLTKYNLFLPSARWGILQDPEGDCLWLLLLRLAPSTRNSIGNW